MLLRWTLRRRKAKSRISASRKHIHHKADFAPSPPLATSATDTKNAKTRNSRKKAQNAQKIRPRAIAEDAGPQNQDKFGIVFPPRGSFRARRETREWSPTFTCWTCWLRHGSVLGAILYQTFEHEPEHDLVAAVNFVIQQRGLTHFTRGFCQGAT